MRWSSKRVAKLALALFLPLALLLTLEGILRVTMRPPVFHPDARYLYRLDTGGAWARRDASISRRGYRGPEIVVPKPAGTFRILALGGSTTFGHDLHDDETWPARLQVLLQTAGHRVEVVNGGVPGWGVAQCAMRLRDDGSWLEPDLVLIYTGWNYPQIDPLRSFSPFPYHASLIGKLPLWVLESRLFLTIAERSRKLLGESAPQVAETTPKRELLADGIRALVQDARALGVPVAVIRYPALLGACSRVEDLAAYREPLMRPTLAASRTPESVFKSSQRSHLRTLDTLSVVARDACVPLLDVAAAFEPLPAAQRATMFLDRMHPSAAGAQHIAHVLAELLAPMLPPR